MQPLTRASLTARNVRSWFQPAAARLHARRSCKGEKDSGDPPALAAMPSVQRILVPIDFSEASNKALRRAVTVATQCQAALTLLHVVDINAQPGPDEPARGEALMKHLWAEGSARVGQLASSLCGQVEAHTLVTEGLPWEVIIVRSREFDLVILGKSSNGRSRLFSHHTIRRVLEGAGCPVMVVNSV